MIRYITLGIIQGLTEFFPVSSSGHLVIMQKVLGVTGNEIALSVVLHLGTCAALVVFFFRDILGLLRNVKLLGLVIIVTIITGIIGLSGRGFFERLFTSRGLVAVSLIITGIILLATRRFTEYKRKDLGIKDAAILGITQGIAIIPGISRSGITISTLLFRKVDRQTCFRFSFLASIPAVFGAAFLEAGHITKALTAIPIGNVLAGFAASFISGIIALWLLRIILHKAKLHFFGYYCIIVAIVTLIYIK